MSTTRKVHALDPDEPGRTICGIPAAGHDHAAFDAEGRRVVPKETLFVTCHWCRREIERRP